jgi:hypothetical protein
MMLSAPLPDAMALYLRWERREPEALAEVAKMFPPGSECFTCGSEVGDDPGLFSGTDPANPRVTAILAPLCPACMSLPKLYRMAKVNRMYKAMFGAKAGRGRLLRPNELRQITRRA